MALFNVRINELITDNNLDCLGTDAPATLLKACPHSYTFSVSCREGKKGGGTASIHRETLKARNVDLGIFNSEYNATLLNSAYTKNHSKLKY